MERNDFKEFTDNGWVESKTFTFLSIPESIFPISVSNWINERRSENCRYSKYHCDCCKTHWNLILENDENAKVNLIETIHTEYNIINKPFEIKSNKYICDKCLDTLIKIKKLNRL